MGCQIKATPIDDVLKYLERVEKHGYDHGLPSNHWFALCILSLPLKTVLQLVSRYRLNTRDCVIGTKIFALIQKIAIGNDLDLLQKHWVQITEK